MTIRLLFITACLLCTTALPAQNADKAVIRSVEKFFKEYTPKEGAKVKNCALERRRNNVIVNKASKRIVIYANQNFSGQVFTPAIVDDIYKGIRKALPSAYSKYDLRVIAARRPIEELVPNNLRGKKIDNARMWGAIDYKGEPWVKNVSKPYNVSKGLDGRHIALWQSHGRFYKAEEGRWLWQRPSLFCTTEDLFTQSIVVPFLMPMLQNAGAIVYTPRERDWQPECVVVDNDAVQGASQFTLQAEKHREWVTHSPGFMPRDSVYVDGDNPFTHGTVLQVETSTGKKNCAASARWHPDIPSDGDYAVYVSYKSMENSVPDAHYSVLHSGGVTNFRVNQRMAGGTWTYLGTFHFKKGLSEGQGVVLSNDSKHKGVVTADAVRFGGGMGVVARGDTLLQTSGLPRYLEGARYALQYAGFDTVVYTPSGGELDYNDDINCRSHAVNHLSGGSVYNPDTTGLNVPIELSFGFHSDAGVSPENDVIGSLAVVTTDYNGDTIATGLSRYISRDIASNLLLDVQRDLSAHYGEEWRIRGILDRSYSESRLPAVPSVIFESLSHQNFKDMSFGHNPEFKFLLARAVYKSLLRRINYMHGTECVVQPLPVRSFSLSFNENCSKVCLRWKGVRDALEPSASPESYVIYTKINDGGYDEGRVVKGESFEMSVLKDVLYSFKVTALNSGGESFPSEELSAYASGSGTAPVLIVNGFHRLSGPAEVCSASRAGFDMENDPGVPYMRSPEYCGPQLDFERSNIGFEDGLGLSGNEYEGMLVAGNTFNYPYIHGKAMAANGLSFVSCSSEAVMEGVVNLAHYKVVDLILGAEKQGGKGSPLNYNMPYKSFPEKLQDELALYLNDGGNLFVSGAYMASDMSKNSKDRKFIRSFLKFDYGGSMVDIAENEVFGSNLLLPVKRTVNEECYAVSRPDILAPAKDAFAAFVYNKSKKSAGIAYSGKYKVIAVSIPFEAVADETLRAQLMGSVMRFLTK